jgi:hypothetical protein
MMTATECRAKAKDAIKRAGAATSPLRAEQWQQNAKEWIALAVILEGQEILIKNLLDREPG